MLKILSIEDSKCERMLLAQIFGKLAPDMELELAVNFTAGMRVLKEKQYDLILMDLHTGDESSPEKDVRSVLGQSRGAPVIVLSGADYSNGVAEQCLLAGADDYFDKALVNEDADVLIRSIRKTILRAQGKKRHATA